MSPQFHLIVLFLNLSFLLTETEEESVLSSETTIPTGGQWVKQLELPSQAVIV